MTIFNSIITRPASGPAVNFTISPNGKILLVLSPGSVNLLASNEVQARVLGHFQLNQSQKDEYGSLLYSSWLSDTSFICFSSKGHVLLCFITIGENTLKITLKMAITSEPGSTFTSATGYNEYIFGGDNKGRLLIMSYKLASTYIHEICNIPLKKIYILETKGYIQSEDDSIYVFDIEPDIYTNPDYKIEPIKLDFKANVMTTCASYVFICGNDNKFYYCKPSVDKEFKTIDSTFKVSSIAPLNDDKKCVYLAGPSRISVFNFVQQTLTDIERSNLPDIFAFAVSSGLIYISNSKGIYIYELLKQQDGCFFTQTAVYETRLLSSGVACICHTLPDKILNHIKGIKLAAFSKTHIACIGINKNLAMYNLSNDQWFTPTHPDVDPIMMTWCGLDLCIVDYAKGVYSVKLLKADMKTGFEMGPSSDLSAKPYTLSSYYSIITLSLPNQIVLLRKDFKIIRIQTQFSAIKIIPFSSYDYVFALLMDKSLIAVKPRDPNAITIAKDVVNFFVDESLNTLTFATSKEAKELSYCFIDKPTDIFKIGKYDGFPIHQFDTLPMVVQVLGTDLLHPFFSEFNYNVYIQKIKIAYKFLGPLRDYSRFTSIVTKLASQLITTKNNKDELKDTIDFMKHYPEIFGNKASDYFAFLTVSEKKENGNLTVFESKTNAFFNAYSLLQIIMEEEGQNVAYPAAILLLHQNLENDSYVVKILTFLKPVITREEGISDELIKYLEESVIQCFVSLLRKYRPDMALLYAKRFNRPLSEFVKSEKSVDSSFSVITIIDKIEELMKSGKMSQKALNKLQVQMMRANWVRWLCACLAINDRKKDLLLVLSKRPKVREEIANSEKWKHLLEESA